MNSRDGSSNKEGSAMAALEQPESQLPPPAPELVAGFQDVPWLWWDGLAGIAFLLPWRLLFLFPRDWMAQLPWWLLWVILYFMPVSWRLVFPLWLARRRLPTFWLFFPGARVWLQEGLIALVLVGGIVGIQLALFLVLAAAESSLSGDVPTGLSSWTDVLLLVSSLTIAPATEEVFFRGLVFNWLKRCCPAALALLLQGIIFGLLHPADLTNTAVLSLFGVLLALLYQWRKTLLAPILFHALKNSVAVVTASVLGPG
jgi:membrane protease YdiL (CAAX protease family)